MLDVHAGCVQSNDPAPLYSFQVSLSLSVIFSSIFCCCCCIELPHTPTHTSRHDIPIDGSFRKASIKMAYRSTIRGRARASSRPRSTVFFYINTVNIETHIYNHHHFPILIYCRYKYSRFLAESEMAVRIWRWRPFSIARDSRPGGDSRVCMYGELLLICVNFNCATNFRALE